MNNTIRIPVLAPNGEVVLAHAEVDASDAPLSSYTWRLRRGYAYRKTGGRHVFMHREVLELKVGDGLRADHINGNRLDNRRCNLRLATNGQNAQNKRSLPGSSSRYRGVTRHVSTGKWQAQASVNGRNHYLGLFEDEALAAVAASEFRTAHMPFSVEATP